MSKAKIIFGALFGLAAIRLAFGAGAPANCTDKEVIRRTLEYLNALPFVRQGGPARVEQIYTYRSNGSRTECRAQLILPAISQRLAFKYQITTFEDGSDYRVVADFF